MSHFVKIRTSIREREHLMQALRDLGHTVEEGPNLTIQGDSGKTELAAIVVRTGSGYDVGFQWSGEDFTAVADWYRIEQATELKRKDFLEAVTRRYAYNVIRAHAQEENLIVEEETVEDGNIVIVLSERG
jgi:hypothetical protein